MWMWNFLQDMENWCSDIEIKSRISHVFDLDVSAVGSFFHPFLFFQVWVTDGLRIHFYGSVVLKRDRTYVSTIISVHELWELTEDWDWGPKWQKWAVSTPNTRWRVFGKSRSVWFRVLDQSVTCSVLFCITWTLYTRADRLMSDFVASDVMLHA